MYLLPLMTYFATAAAAAVAVGVVVIMSLYVSIVQNAIDLAELGMRQLA